MHSEKLPKFKNPPVIETVLGVQFDPLPKFGNAHLGAFWQSFRPEDWPNVNDAPSIEPQFERFGEENRGRVGGFMLKLTSDLNLRLQIRNNDKTRMIQVQNGRLHYNWLGHGGDSYPNYDKVKPEFDAVLNAFKKFIANQYLGDLHLNQWEITYVNHIPQGSIWNEPQDWIGIFPSLTPLSTKTSRIELESFGGEWHYEIKPNWGRLHVNIAHGVQQRPSEQEIIVLNLTARGPLPSSDGQITDYEDGFRVGYETIVTSFKELTSETAHKSWGLVND
ncbi:MAG TPA: TIGR04255 family protein [Thermoguttaceae bacterium]